MPPTDDTLVKVGDVWATTVGEAEIERISILLQPREDPKGEGSDTTAEAMACEFALPFIVDLTNGKWAEKSQMLYRVDESD